LLPALAAHTSATLDGDVCLVPFAPPVPKRTIGFAWRMTSPRGREFGELARLFHPHPGPSKAPSTERKAPPS